MTPIREVQKSTSLIKTMPFKLLLIPSTHASLALLIFDVSMTSSKKYKAVYKTLWISIKLTEHGQTSDKHLQKMQCLQQLKDTKRESPPTKNLPSSPYKYAAKIPRGLQNIYLVNSGSWWPVHIIFISVRHYQQDVMKLSNMKSCAI